MRRAGRIDANQAEIVKALRAIGCSVQSLAGVGNGCADLVVNLTRRTTYSLKRAEIKEVLKDGGEVPGADLGFGQKRLEVR